MKGWSSNERRGLKLLEEILSSCHFIHQKSHVDWPEDPFYRADSPATNRLGHDSSPKYSP